jgi:hypothetical protein
MVYQKRRSTILAKAQARLQGLQSVQPEMALGNSLTLQAYADLIAAVDDRLIAHNVALSAADRTRIELVELETALSTLSSRMLSAVVANYGKNSKAYEMAGGKLPKPARRTSKPPSATVPPDSPADDSQAIFSSAPSNGAAKNGSAILTAIA